MERDLGRGRAGAQRGEGTGHGRTGAATGGPVRAGGAEPIPRARRVDWALAHLSERDSGVRRNRPALRPRWLTAPVPRRSRPSNGRWTEFRREGRPARRSGLRGGRRARHRQGGGRGTRNGRADADRRGPRQGADARLDGRPASAKRTAHRRSETGGEAHPVREGPHGRGPGVTPEPARRGCSTAPGRSRRRRVGAWSVSPPRRRRYRPWRRSRGSRARHCSGFSRETRALPRDALRGRARGKCAPHSRRRCW